MSRIKHKFDKDLIFMLSYLTDDQYIEWLVDNEITWDKPLIELIQGEMNENLPTY